MVDVMIERARQHDLGFTEGHDDAHANWEMSRAASIYALQPHSATIIRDDGRAPIGWPWEAKWWKPKSPREDLVRAAALIVAEIERLDRLASTGGSDGR